MKLRRLIAASVLLTIFASLPARADTFSTYYVGNSLTGDLYNAFRKIAAAYEKSQGNTFAYGFEFRSATGVTWIYNHPSPGPDAKGKVDRTCSGVGLSATAAPPKTNLVPWPIALPGNHWDVVTMQPSSDNQMPTNLQSDTTAINGLITAAKTRPDNAKTRFYIYAPWPSIKYADLDSYRIVYLSVKKNDSLTTRQYVTDLAESVRKTNPEVGVIPAGEVFYVLDDMMKAGKFEHFDSIRQLHRDGVHLNSVGQNIDAWIGYAVIFKKSPVGLPNEPRGNSLVAPYTNVTDISPADLKLMQETIWDVVRKQSKYTLVQ